MVRVENIRGRQFIGVLAVLVSVFSAPWAAAVNPNTYGAEYYNTLLENDGLYPDEEWQEYVTEIGERLLAVSPHKGQSYTFVVEDTATTNAFATADAYIFITRGLLSLLNSEDELAGVIGHEIGHVVGKHIKRTNSASTLGKLIGIIGMFATGTSATSDLAAALTNTAVANYGRENELEADDFGAGYLALAGYNPRSLIDSMQMLRDSDKFNREVKNQPSVYHGLFGSHPAHAKRLHELVAKSQHLFPDELRGPERDFHAMLDGLVYGDESAAGIVKDGKYYHGSLRMVVTFPKDWEISATGREVSGTAPNGTAEGYIGIQRQEPPGEEQTPEQYLTDTLKRDDLKDGEALEVNGYHAYVASIEVASGGAKLRKIAVLYKDGGVFLFKGEAGANGDATAFEAQFRATLESFRAMTANDMREANNQRLVIVEAKPGDTYKKLAKGAPMKAAAEQTLRMINGHYPVGEPRAGDMIKVVR